MTKFISPALKEFLESHTRLNSFAKVTVVAIDVLSKSTNSDKELSDKINELILKAGERWTPRIINDPNSYLEEIKNDLVKSAIIWVYSAFDIFFKGTEGQLSSAIPKFENEEEKKENDDNKETTIVRLYKKMKWSTVEIDSILPIASFYKELRNCIAHNMGYPSSKLCELSESREFKDAITNWRTKFPKKTISPPPIVTEQTIKLRPHHSILYSESCKRIAEDINQKLFDTIGLNHFIEKTIKNHLKDASELSIPVCVTYTKYIICHIKQDFGLSITYEQFSKFYNSRPDKKRDTGKYDLMKKRI